MGLLHGLLGEVKDGDLTANLTCPGKLAEVPVET